ncbi:small ribosomal subunit protein bS6m [Culicoides brevitarsis]|uniref:small ribosomal subunit protein bS6m n=1 Tax=Culicoides brevitarsis TaxID=469753 RepID=UPI00307BF78F
MPTYELVLIMRQMARPDLVSALKRTSKQIFDHGGFLRKLENFGTKQLPFKMSKNEQTHRVGIHYLMEFDVPPTQIDSLHEEFKRDVDIIRKHIVRKAEPEPVECTLHEELLPAAYRKDVAEMIHKAKNSKKQRQEEKRTVWKSNTGMDYYPFLR